MDEPVLDPIAEELKAQEKTLGKQDKEEEGSKSLEDVHII